MGGLALIPIDEGGSVSWTCHATGENHGGGPKRTELADGSYSHPKPDLTDYLPSGCKP